jgi:hypothetical protein
MAERSPRALEENSKITKARLDARIKALGSSDDTLKALTELAKQRQSQKDLQARFDQQDKTQQRMLDAAERRQERSLEAKANQDPVLKQNQYAAALYGQRAQDADQIFSKLSSGSYDPTDATSGLQRMLPNFLQSSESQQQDQAERNFVNAVLRRESGAAISKSEFDNAEKQYFPRAGDAPEVLANKARNRQIAQAALKAESGPAWERVSGTLSALPPQTLPAGRGGQEKWINDAQADAPGLEAATMATHWNVPPALAAKILKGRRGGK